jgi:hypothetical protein
MKGLLLKDWYMIQKYCRSYILITAVFISITATSLSSNAVSSSVESPSMWLRRV